jgi:hypothetical protein
MRPFFMARGGSNATNPKEQKFLRRFFQKAATFFNLPCSRIIAFPLAHF